MLGVAEAKCGLMLGCVVAAGLAGVNIARTGELDTRIAAAAIPLHIVDVDRPAEQLRESSQSADLARSRGLPQCPTWLCKM